MSEIGNSVMAFAESMSLFVLIWVLVLRFPKYSWLIMKYAETLQTLNSGLKFNQNIN
jgi:hypothetical protein